MIGRRNWLLADTPKGAEASATLYTFIETAKANGHDPYRYLRFLFTGLPAAATTAEQIAALLSFNIPPDALPPALWGRGFVDHLQLNDRGRKWSGLAAKSGHLAATIQLFDPSHDLGGSPARKRRRAPAGLGPA